MLTRNMLSLRVRDVLCLVDVVLGSILLGMLFPAARGMLRRQMSMCLSRRYTTSERDSREGRGWQQVREPAERSIGMKEGNQ